MGGQDLSSATQRCDEMAAKLENVENVEDEVKAARIALEENQTKFTEAERKYVVVKRDIERTTTKADSLEKRVELLEGTIASATDSLKELEEREGESSLKEERNAEELILLEGQFKEAEVRAEAATRSCQVLERNLDETQAEIDEWQEKTRQLESEIAAMNDIADDDD